MRNRSLRERPENFRLDYGHSLARGLVFAGLGRTKGSAKYIDSSPYGNHGTLANMDPATDWVWDSTLNRFALNFDGDEYISIPAMLTVAPITMACWFQSASVANNYNLVALGASGASGADYFMLTAAGAVAGDKIRAMSDGAEGASSAASANAYTVNTWYHGVAVFESTTSRTAYDNGIPGSVDTTEITPTNITLGTIGGLRRTALTGGLVGKLADALIYNRVLSSSEIQQLADPSNVMLSGLILPPRRRLWAVSASSTNRRRRLLIAGVSR